MGGWVDVATVDEIVERGVSLRLLVPTGITVVIAASGNNRVLLCSLAAGIRP